jgi:hypothetical protein
VVEGSDDVSILIAGVEAGVEAIWPGVTDTGITAGQTLNVTV